MKPLNASSEQVDALFKAAENGDVAMIKQLVASGIGPDVRTKLKHTPLMRAAEHDREEAFQVLVAAGADVHATRGYGDSVLRFAVIGKSASRLRMVQAIIGADGIKPDDSLTNAFDLACRLSSVEIVNALLTVGADANHEGLPLLKAVNANRPEIVAALVKAGANVNIRVPAKNKHWKKTLLEAALAEGFTEVAQILQSAGAKLPKQRKQPSQPGQVADSWKRIAFWIENNAPHWAPLHAGATAGELEGAEIAIGFRLPEELRELYASHNGSKDLFPTSDNETYCLLPLVELIGNWNSQKQLLDGGDFADLQPTAAAGIKKDWWNVGWIPFASNGGGDCYCVDMAPDRDGVPGQVITHNHESGEHKRLASCLREWLEQFANDLEDGKYSYDNKRHLLV